VMNYNNARMTRQRLQYNPNRGLDPDYVKNMMAVNSNEPSMVNDLSSILGESQGQANVKGLGLDNSMLERAQREYGIESPMTSQSPQNAPKSSGSGLGTEDWVGMGLQAYGAMRADKEDEAERKRQEAKDEQAMMRQGIADREAAQMAERQMQQQDRSQDMTGLNYLAQQRANAMQNRTAYSFRNNFAKALRG
jgi:hypothetical protein